MIYNIKSYQPKIKSYQKNQSYQLPEKQVEKQLETT